MPDLTLIEKLHQIANAVPGGPMPECLRAPDAVTGFENSNWGIPLSAICKEAADTLERYHRFWNPNLPEDL